MGSVTSALQSAVTEKRGDGVACITVVPSWTWYWASSAVAFATLLHALNQAQSFIIIRCRLKQRCLCFVFFLQRFKCTQNVVT